MSFNWFTVLESVENSRGQMIHYGKIPFRFDKNDEVHTTVMYQLPWMVLGNPELKDDWYKVIGLESYAVNVLPLGTPIGLRFTKWIEDPENPLLPKRYIVCAANQDRFSGMVAIGVRHHDRFMNDIIRTSGKDFTASEQGFIDQFGIFLSRTEAWKIAMEANQIRKRFPSDEKDGGTLYSENLY